VNQNHAKIMTIALGLGALVCVAVAQETKDPSGPVQTYRKEAPKGDNEAAEKKGGHFQRLPEKRTNDRDTTEGPLAENDPARPGMGAFPEMKRQAGQAPESPKTTSPKYASELPRQPVEVGNSALNSFAPGPRVIGQSQTEYVNARGGEDRLAQDAEQVARAIGGAKSQPERDKLVAQLGEILEKHFDFRQRRHEGEIAQLEAQVRKLRELVQKRQENRREIIARRMDVIVRDAEGLGW
jgi:hypothetical protein